MLSACLIVKNEQKYLAFCLKSLEGLADEIIVVDTGSTDATRKIAAQFKASVYEFPWQNDFSAARNFSISKAQGDWIFIIDADELVPKLTLQKIKETLGKPEFPAYYLPVFSIKFSEREKALKNFKTVPPKKVYYLIRLFKNHEGFEFQGPLHETVGFSIFKKKFASGILPYPLAHYGFEVAKPGRIIRNLLCTLEGLKTQASDYTYLYNYGKTLASLGCFELAGKVLEKSLNGAFLQFASSEKLTGTSFYQIQKEISENYLNLNDFQNAAQNFALAYLLNLKDARLDLESLFQISLIYLKLGQKEIAQKIFGFIIKNWPKNWLEAPPSFSFNPMIFEICKKYLRKLKIRPRSHKR